MNLTMIFWGIVTLIIIYWYIRDGVRNAERYRLLNALRKIPVRSVPLLGQCWYFLGSPQSKTISNSKLAQIENNGLMKIYLQKVSIY